MSREGRLQFIRVWPILQQRTDVDVGTECYGIDVLNDTIYLSCLYGRIRQFDMNGNPLEELGPTFQKPLYMKVSHTSGNIYVSDYMAGSVTCMTPAGDTLFVYTNSSLSQPLGIIIDDLDNFIVIDNNEHNIHVIMARDRVHRILLTSELGAIIHSPYSIAFRRNDKTMLVGLRDSTWFNEFNFFMSD